MDRGNARAPPLSERGGWAGDAGGRRRRGAPRKKVPNIGEKAPAVWDLFVAFPETICGPGRNYPKTTRTM